MKVILLMSFEKTSKRASIVILRHAGPTELSQQSLIADGLIYGCLQNYIHEWLLLSRQQELLSMISSIEQSRMN